MKPSKNYSILIHTALARLPLLILFVREEIEINIRV